MINYLNVLNDIKDSLKECNLTNNSTVGNVVLSTESGDGQYDKVIDTINVGVAGVSNTLPGDLKNHVVSTEAAQEIAAVASNQALGISTLRGMSIDNSKYDGVVSGSEFGAGDVIPFGKISTEAFEKTKDPELTIYFSTTATLLATRQDEFGEAFFPTIHVPFNAPGLEFKVNYGSFYKSFERSVSGSRKSLEKESIFQNLYNGDIFKSDKNRLIPVFTQDDAENVKNLIGDVKTFDERGFEKVLTAPIRFGKTVDLIGISQTTKMLSKGLMDETDTVDAAIGMESVWAKIGAEYFSFPVGNMAGSNFTMSVQGNSREMVLTFDEQKLTMVLGTTTKFDGSASTVLNDLALPGYSVDFVVSINGTGDLENGSFKAYGSAIEVGDIRNAAGKALPTDDANYKKILAAVKGITLEGWYPDGHRTNVNKRIAGVQVTADDYNVLYSIPARSGIMIKSPSNKDMSIDGAINQHVQVLGAKVSLDAIETIKNHAAYLKLVTNNGATTEVVSGFRGVAGRLVKHYYAPVPIDLNEIVDSTNSSDRDEDIKAAIALNIKTAVIDAYTKSNYNVVFASLHPGSKPTVNIGCPPELKATLTSNGGIDLGEDFNVKVVTSLFSGLENKMYISFGLNNESTAKSMDPIAFGACGWSPTMTFVVPKTDNNAAIEETHHTPRYLHVVNLPILIEVDISNYKSVIGKVVGYRKDK